MISDAVNRKLFSGKRRSLLWEVGMSKIDRTSIELTKHDHDYDESSVSF